jgi:uncharacterized membrane protein YkvI
MKFLKFQESQFFRKYLLPGIIFQSVVIGGGYGTGRETVEYFVKYGPLGALLGIIITFVVWGIVAAATFEFARVFKAYNYRDFFSKLTGKFWILIDISYWLMLLLVLAVCASAAGSILQGTFGLNYYIGVIGLLIGIGILVIIGKEAIEHALSVWTYVLYVVYIITMIAAFTKFGGSTIFSKFGLEKTILPGWVLSGFKYSFYNLVVFICVLFSLNYIETRKEAIVSGFIASAIGAIPIVFLIFAMLAKYPEVVKETVPISLILNSINSKPLIAAFEITLFGTLIETGTGFIFAVRERVASVYEEKKTKMPRWITVIITVAILVAAVLIAKFGLIALIAKGYGTMSWVFLLVYAIPIVSIGVWRIFKEEKRKHFKEASS